MKKYIILLFTFILAVDSFAQIRIDCNTEELHENLIRPSVELFAGYPISKFYQSSDFFHKLPYTTGALLGIALPEKRGSVIVNTGFVLEGTSMNNILVHQGNQTQYHNRLCMANFPVMIGYDGFVGEGFSLFGEGGFTLTRVIKRTEEIIDAKPILGYFSAADSWDDLLVASIAGRLGVRYWFHPRFALFMDVTYKHYFHVPLEGEVLLRPTVSATIGVSFR